MVNSKDAPTPEHNKLQIRFYDNNFILKLFPNYFKIDVDVDVKQIYEDLKSHVLFENAILVQNEQYIAIENGYIKYQFDLDAPIKNSCEVELEGIFNWDVILDMRVSKQIQRLFYHDDCLANLIFNLENEKLHYEEQPTIRLFPEAQAKASAIRNNKTEESILLKEPTLINQIIEEVLNPLCDECKFYHKLCFQCQRKKIWEKNIEHQRKREPYEQKINYLSKFREWILNNNKISTEKLFTEINGSALSTFTRDIYYKHRDNYYTIDNLSPITDLSRSKLYKIFIEIKTSLGDDYPCVLRKMKEQIYLTNSKYKESKGIRYCLVIETFNSEAINSDQLHKIFNDSGIIVIILDEIDINENTSKNIKLENLPNLLEND
jgi:hypothetical protein